MKLKLYEVELKTVIVVAATSEKEALEKSNNTAMQREVVRDSPMEAEVQHEIKEIGSLPYGWVGVRIPYGGDGNTTITEFYSNGDA